MQHKISFPLPIHARHAVVKTPAMYPIALCQACQRRSVDEPRSGERVVPTWLVTGGAGFIGGNFVLEAVAKGVRVINLDALTYAGNTKTLAPLEGNPSHVFV